MATMSGRNKLQAFVGGVELIFGFLFVIMGLDSVILFRHSAVGVLMWTGILIIMVGLGSIMQAFPEKRNQNNGQSINFGSMLVNLTGLVLACLLIGFFVWGAYDEVLRVGVSKDYVGTQAVYTVGDLISIFATVITMATVLLILTLAALVADCCGFLLFGMPTAAPPAWNGSPARNPAHSYMYDGPYGLPPEAMYKR